MSMNADLKKTIVAWCATNKLEVAHAVDLYYEIRGDLEWPEDSAASDEIKGALIDMRGQREGLYGMDYALMDEWIAALYAANTGVKPPREAWSDEQSE